MATLTKYIASSSGSLHAVDVKTRTDRSSLLLALAIISVLQTEDPSHVTDPPIVGPTILHPNVSYYLRNKGKPSGPGPRGEGDSSSSPMSADDAFSSSVITWVF